MFAFMLQSLSFNDFDSFIYLNYRVYVKNIENLK